MGCVTSIDRAGTCPAPAALKHLPTNDDDSPGQNSPSGSTTKYFPAPKINGSDDDGLQFHYSSSIGLNNSERMGPGWISSTGTSDIDMNEHAWQIFSEIDTLKDAEIIALSEFLTSIMQFEEIQHLSDERDSRDLTTEHLNLDNISVCFEEDVPIFEDINKYEVSMSDILKPKTPVQIASVYRRGGTLHSRLVQRILRLMYKRVEHLPNVTFTTFSESEKFTVVGDIHGQLNDLMFILDNSGWPSATNRYLFNGDFVDRGSQGLEVVVLLFSLFVAFPDFVFLNRGNHEEKSVCNVYGFMTECLQKYDRVVYEMFCEIFRYLPLCTVINNSIFVLHGGLFHDDKVTINDLQQIDRKNYYAKKMDFQPNTGEAFPRDYYLTLLEQCVLWSDPLRGKDTVTESIRGPGVMFGPSVTMAFLERNQLNLVIRSHECVPKGFEWPFEGTPAANKLCTVFSASNYVDCGNMGSFIDIYNHAVPRSNLVEGTNMHFVVHSFTTASADKNQNIWETSKRLLSDLIALKWNALKSNFATADTENSGFISENSWADIMQNVTRLNILWLQLKEDLVPLAAMEGSRVNYAQFLSVYKKTGMLDLSEHAVHHLYEHNHKLEAIFNFFDADGDRLITLEEFRKGFKIMNDFLPETNQLHDPDEILRMLGLNKAGGVNLNEFFEAFRIVNTQKTTPHTNTIASSSVDKKQI